MNNQFIKNIELHKIGHNEYIKNWNNLFNQIFKNEIKYQFMNNSDVVSILDLSSNIFHEIYFKEYQEIFSLTKENNMLIVLTNYDNICIDESSIYLKYNLPISWEDFSQNNNYIYNDLNFYNDIMRNYFLFGNNGIWGRLAITDCYMNYENKNIGFQFDIYKIKNNYFDLLTPILEKYHGKIVKIEFEIKDILKKIFPDSNFKNTYIFKESFDWFLNNYKL